MYHRRCFDGYESAAEYVAETSSLPDIPYRTHLIHLENSNPAHVHKYRGIFATYRNQKLFSTGSIASLQHLFAVVDEPLSRRLPDKNHHV